MILGDINVNFFEQNCSLFKNYKSILDLFNFKQLIKNSTRITDTSSTLIDHIICNNESKICQSGTVCVGLSDHHLIYCTRKVLKSQISSNHKVIKIRSLRNYSVEDLLAVLSAARLGLVFTAVMLTSRGVTLRQSSCRSLTLWHLLKRLDWNTGQNHG